MKNLSDKYYSKVEYSDDSDSEYNDGELSMLRFLVDNSTITDQQIIDLHTLLLDKCNIIFPKRILSNEYCKDYYMGGDEYYAIDGYFRMNFLPNVETRLHYIKYLLSIGCAAFSEKFSLIKNSYIEDICIPNIDKLCHLDMDISIHHFIYFAMMCHWGFYKNKKLQLIICNHQLLFIHILPYLAYDWDYKKVINIVYPHHTI
jgi:hypothetical protein